ncbi:MAG: hypothetical protein LBH10_06310, partial [Burkholderiaceae bacterium]|nr:hypothetical protein [Burkholderiaceae bacterium]
MAKEAEIKAGLLGKVAKFIRNPTLDWADIDRADAPHSQMSLDSAQARQALKEMIKRKRRNDLVRKREFDTLRKIRRKGRGASTDGLNTMALDSSYSSSQLVHDAEKWDHEQKREWTLHQIDEIEAQLSRSWFRRPGEIPTVPMKLRTARAQLQNRNTGQ